jgi:hypothetical protein
MSNREVLFKSPYQTDCDDYKNDSIKSQDCFVKNMQQIEYSKCKTNLT